MRSVNAILPRDWNDFIVAERFAFHRWVRMKNAITVPGYIHPISVLDQLKQFLVGWVAGVTMVRGGAAFDYRGTVLRDLPLAYWRMDNTSGTVQDDQVLTQVGSPHNLTKSPAPLFNQPGLLFLDNPNLCVTFDGATEHDMASSNSSFWPDSNEAASLECWFQTPTVLAGKVMTELRNFAAGDERRANECSIDGTTGFVRGRRVQAAVDTNPDVFNDDQPHHIVVTAPARGTLVVPTVRLYVDGQFYGSDQSGSNTDDPATTHTVTVGADGFFPSTVGSRWDGEVDEVAVYDFELTQTQVTKHYNAGALGFFG